MSATAPCAGPSPIRRPLAAAALLATLACLVFGLLLAGAGPASAHAALTGSDPADGAVVDTAPQQVTLSFSEAIAVGDDSIRVLDPSGKRADTEAGPEELSEGSTVRYGVSLHSGLPDGTYTVAWQAISADSHPISGAFTFSIGAPSETTVALPSEGAGGGPVGFLYDIARYTAYGGFAVLVGGSAFVLVCWRGGAASLPMQRLVVRGWLALTGATLVMLLLRYPYTGSGKFADAFDLAGLQSVLDTKPGAALVSRLLLLGAAALFTAVLFGTYARREDERERKDLAFGLAVGGGVVATGIAATWSMSEHASTGIQTNIAMPVDILHLLAVAAWLGGLASLLVALYRTPDIGSAAVRRFSAVAFGSVAVLAATGVYQSWRQVGSWTALTGTRYGQLLILKVALIALLLGVAWFSRRWTGRLTDPAAAAEARGDAAGSDAAGEEAEEADDVPDDVAPERAAQLARQRAALTATKKKRIRDADPERSGLRRSVLAEAAVAVVLLVVTTMLTSTEPGRTQEEAAGSSAASAPAAGGPVNLSMPFDTGGRNGKGTVRIGIEPGRTGSNDLHVWIDGSDGEPMDVPELKLALTLESKDIGPLPVVPDRLAEGHWSASGVQIPMAGDWTIDVTVRTSDIDQVTIDKNTKIG
ncbi:copper resistance protein CopC [Streptomyces sp. YPW6]|uniref:copper resistance CopC/CopD family protein n=1 Tax=Streptomyces sp. YPW6 TaxID=2840373 RepID=UPI001C0E3090|nr:copper resistance protein CopC [Streptomyces sp. YPW6]QWQ42421.1 copper resistance protein CopC [Streptomyces sp. YPW6]